MRYVALPACRRRNTGGNVTYRYRYGQPKKKRTLTITENLKI
jgi:hypothetical protein